MSDLIMMVAGEASGDLLGGALLSALHTRLPDLRVIGVGGVRMREQGLHSEYDVNDLSVVGLVEVIRRLPRLWQVMGYLTRLLQQQRPSLLITIDLPDFNFILARRAKALGIRVVHYVSPQVWAWRSGRIKKIARWIDHLLVLFPFEVGVYAHSGLAVTFVGHPLSYLAVARHSRAEMRARLSMRPDERLVVLLPGSRFGELSRLLAPMLASCRELQHRLQNVRFVLALADTLTVTDLASCWPADMVNLAAEGVRIEWRQGETYSLLAAADAALVASGTATLEAALLDAPMVVVYRVNQLTYAIGRRVIRVPYISLANLVAGYGLVVERIQHEVQAVRLADDLQELLTDSGRVSQLRAGYSLVRESLSHADRHPEDVIIEMLGGSARKGDFSVVQPLDRREKE
ncbi:lipid-A-disaccharide synthase [Candidatus Magnetaquicoccus inordinatus]|uniref:lipid-A-disaccharide synthase n=1 Tax=Candidatus Magnetaquicoccus inordinatus TaxID=2496818 RepID=UPI00102C904A|nr:lipid-A-disaccharide synthase [Candidatus Magnetaquicoccus inordinatus]